MSVDTIEKFEGAVIQHGPYNNRIYLMKLGEANPAELIPALKNLAVEKGYTKIFAKIPEPAGELFLRAGYEKEGAIPGFYGGKEDALFLARFFSENRRRAENAEELDNILELSKSKMSAPSSKALDDAFTLRSCTAKDVTPMSQIYTVVFPSYPFPIHDPGYLQKTMETHIDYYGVEYHGQLIALSSAEMDSAKKNVEMTDFATLPNWRGHALAVHLLARMEDDMRTKNFKTAYTIARAVSPGMNITFAKMGYQYGGRLVNNTNISGSTESMNIWHKTF